tara:strand:- start:2113 stop:4554 length:2442 start_codon:yes stop_codon:yes gene_type:complete
MLIKNKFFLTIICLINLLLFSSNINADEFDIVANEIIIDKANEIMIGKGNVQATDSKGKTIYADKITYNKLKEFLLAEGNVTIDDNEKNILNTNKASYDKFNEKIITYDNTKLILQEGYKLIGKDISYDILKRTLVSNSSSIFTDEDGNIIDTSMFRYDINNNLFSSVGEIKILDINKNKYFLKEIHINTKDKEMIGSSISVVLDQQNFGLSKDNDPRFVANDIFISQDRTTLSKGVFTVCQKRDNKCPPWSIKAKKIIHDGAKKNIYYEHATLKLYDVPIFYFPKFFHPDPTVKRQSGFLPPFFTNASGLGTGFALPYYWAISSDKDLTFSPKLYTNENILFLNEYRQAFRNGFLTLDTSYTEGYKNTSSTKTDGSRNHIFANLDFNFNQDSSYTSDLFIKLQRTSNDTYFRKHGINTSLVDSENTNLENRIKYSFSKDNMFLDVSSEIYQNLRNKKNSDQYEYIVPNIVYGKTFFTENFGTVNFLSSALYSKYETNKQKTFLTNEISWSPYSFVTKKGFVNTFEGMVRNKNYETKKTSLSTESYNQYKDGDMVNEIDGVISHKVSLPMKKDGINYNNLFSPNLMFRYAPGHMRNLNSKDETLNYTKLYSLNRTSEIEDGMSAVLGFDFKVNEKNTNNEKLSVSLGQVFNHKKNKDIPSKSSLDQRMSDIVGEFNYNFSEIGKINYNFSVDHNYNDINYSEVSTELNFGIVKFNLDYLEENKHVGSEHYATSGITLDFNANNKLSLSTKKNFKTDSTELYDLSYQYAIDCLTAGVVYRREFYQDSDLEPNNTLMFTITFVPFGSVNTPAINQ